MEHLPSWFWIVIECGGVFVCGIGALWFLARRELTRGEPTIRRSWLHTLEQWLVDRVDELVSKPPTWQQIGARLRRVAAALAVLVLVSLAGWALWMHGSEWFTASAPARPSPAPQGSSLPFESVTDSITHSIFPMLCKVMAALSLMTAALWAFLGEGTRAATSVATALMLFFAPFMFGMVTQTFDSALAPPAVAAPAPHAQPDDKPNELVVAALAEAPVESEPANEDPAPPTPTSLDRPEHAQSALSAAPDRSMSLPPSAASEHSSSGFGVGDALMVYGAYKLLTGSEAPRTVVSAPAAAQHVDSPVTTYTPSRSASQQPERGRSTPPTYRAPVSSSRSLGLRARLLSRHTFRRSR